MILGIDASTYLEELEHGAKYFDNGVQIDPLDAFVQNGVNWFRIRVWNNPRSDSGEPYLAGTCGFQHYLKLAKVVKNKGYNILLDFHYSDFWADPGKQMVPKAWRGFDVDQLAQAVGQFTESCLKRAQKEGVAPQMVQIGNEITNGMLWPLCKLELDGKRGNYPNFLKVLDAGCRACRKTLPNAQIMLHLERSNDKAIYQEFFGEVANYGIDYDVIGASYYPYWHGTPSELFANFDNCRVFGKKLMVAELGYGFTDKPYLLNGEKHRLVIDEQRSYVKGFTEKYPLTPQGQAHFVKDFVAMARQKGIDGIFYWEPLWLPGEGICWASLAGQEYINEQGKSTSNEWANQCLFDYQGNKLPAFEQFK